ncbi:hypothetical protein [Fuerstiella marisgermanici]|uniref:Uncharacterized protein n=1 Tax=Fuerstiella marisgermanici TaxID=1891926 RepID=A0A1P8WPY6_9PLAN|nr:hypothetical protein [Fuerstiella marisgermanici]APZ96116.1 hypothetical protein Fuma_05784 [Fuerstiella marisgermanici]
MSSGFDFIQSVSPTSATLIGELRGGGVIWCDIQIELSEFEYEGETENGPVMLECIDFGVTDLSELVNREFTFPRNPEDGYVEGSLCLGYDYIPADLTKIVFGDTNASTIDAVLTIHLVFGWPWKEVPDTFVVEWKIKLAFDSEELGRSFAELREDLETSNYNLPPIEHPVLGTLTYENVTEMYNGSVANGTKSIPSGLSASECDDLDSLVEAACEITADLRNLAAAATEFIGENSDNIDAASSLSLISLVVYPRGAAAWFFRNGTSLAAVTMASDRSFELL